jgi:acetolactate synthase-1/2/3 large subunit
LALLASGLGEETGGGLFAHDNGQLEQIDSISTTGLATTRNKLVRLLWSDTSPESPSGMVVYRRDGANQYFAIPEVREPHGVAVDGTGYIVVSTYNNSIVWVSSDGHVIRSWRAPGEGDSWHLNGITKVGTKLYVSAFGAFAHHREWAEHKTDRSGFVFDLATGHHVLSGLDCPHNAQLIDDCWIVCNSAHGELLCFDNTAQRIVRRCQLSGWTRGLASNDAYFFVGESAHRHRSRTEGRAAVAVIDRRSWQVVDRLTLPCSEIYDLAWTSIALIERVKVCTAGNINDPSPGDRDRCA